MLSSTTTNQEDAAVPPLIESCRPLVRPNGGIIGAEIADATRSSYPTLLSTIPLHESTPFLASIDGRMPISHRETHDFIQDFGQTLHALGVGRGQRVALVLPNGPELALAILAVSQWTACVPLSATGSLTELQADLERCGPDLIIGPYSSGPLPTGNIATTMNSPPELHEFSRKTNVLSSASRDWMVHRAVGKLASDLAISFGALVPDPDRAGPFRVVVPLGRRYNKGTLVYDELPLVPENIAEREEDAPIVDPSPNLDKDEALVLFTSGTTGNKKLVPHVMGDLLTAATVIALSWELVPSDRNCNMMPLFHVGGICRQVFAPLLSGSAVICCPSFDASLFWSLLGNKAFNWYYAAPTMHSVILATGIAEGFLPDEDNPISSASKQQHPLKMIANAAGGLLPSLAQRLRDTFAANVLPSYGMTECMPISSPPATYDLSKPGTSGVPVGPEVAILNLSTVTRLPPREEGPICVRGAPCFRGYGALANDPRAKLPATFLKDGWFNTGDLGFLDEEGYLYITGRSKEVINRGGEIIPPMEVEEALMGHPDVEACAAFSAAHDVLQETVGICIVLKGQDAANGIRRLDLPTLHAFVADKLAAPKWPQCLVYMTGGLPKSHTNKLLRVKLGSRLGLPELTDSMSTWERTFEAECPPQGAALTDPIPSKQVVVDATAVQAQLREALVTDEIWVCGNPSRPGAVLAHVGSSVDRRRLIQLATELLSSYAVPTHVCVVDKEALSAQRLETIPPKPQDAVASILNKHDDEESDPIVEKISEVFVDLLKLDYTLNSDAHFFHIGGSSMLASQLASKIRATFNVPCAGAEIFHHATPKEIAQLVKQRQQGEGPSDDHPKFIEADRSDHNAPFSQTYTAPLRGFWSGFFQLVPLFVLFPCWQIARYFLFFTLLVQKSRYFWNVSDSDLITFLAAYMVFHILWIIFCPLVFVGIKWLVIGRYEAGRYPIRGSYYIRWWIVDICRNMFPRGIWGTSYGTLAFYYRLLGADIGTGARISLDCELAEYDLVKVGRNAAVELCTLRGFGVDNGAMILGPVKVGNEASVGIRSVVPPFTEVPDGQHLGPATSAYDVTLGKALNSAHARVNRMNFPAPSVFLQVVVGAPITFAIHMFSQVPPLSILYMLLWFKARGGEEVWFSNWNELIYWLCSLERIPFFVGIRLARAILSPFFYMMAAIVVKKTIIGEFKPGPRNTSSDWENMRYRLAATIFTKKKLQKCTELMGRHYEGVSTMYRLLGSKIGKRIFWPGSQPITDGTFDLLEIGDDAVFGSRSSILCTTIDHAERVILCAGANVSDNCTVMAGSVIGKNAVLGSNSYCPEGTYLPSGSVWFGSNGCLPTCLHPGDSDDFEFYQPMNEGSGRGIPTHASATLDPRCFKMEGDESTLRPFGKAFYLGRKKGYHVFHIRSIVFFTLVNRILQVIFHLLPLLAAVQFGAVLLYTDYKLKNMWRNSIFSSQTDFYQDNYGVHHDKFLWWNRDFDNAGHYHSFGQIYMAMLACFIVTHFIRVVLWLVIELSAKKLIMGKRKPGRYNYDTSSYGQRWEMYQLVAKIRKISRLNLLQFISGTPLMNSYFRWNGGKVGKDCCLYPAGADPFMPEPDLVSIGEGTVIDCASIVCHLNTRGNFELQKIVIEDKCTLRTRSRLQQGAVMETGSQLLEKSLAMTGEVIDSRSVWQGGPASLWFRYKDEDLVNTYKPPSQLLSNKEVEMQSMGIQK